MNHKHKDKMTYDRGKITINLDLRDANEGVAKIMKNIWIIPPCGRREAGGNKFEKREKPQERKKESGWRGRKGLHKSSQITLLLIYRPEPPMLYVYKCNLV